MSLVEDAGQGGSKWTGIATGFQLVGWCGPTCWWVLALNQLVPLRFSKHMR